MSVRIRERDSQLEYVRQRLENVEHSLKDRLDNIEGVFHTWGNITRELEEYSEQMDVHYPEDNDKQREIFQKTASLMKEMDKEMRSKCLVSCKSNQEACKLERSVRGYIGEINTLKREYKKVQERQLQHLMFEEKARKLEHRSDDDSKKRSINWKKERATTNYHHILSETINRMNSTYQKAPGMFKALNRLFWLLHLECRKLFNSRSEEASKIVFAEEEGTEDSSNRTGRTAYEEIEER